MTRKISLVWLFSEKPWMVRAIFTLLFFKRVFKKYTKWRALALLLVVRPSSSVFFNVIVQTFSSYHMKLNLIYMKICETHFQMNDFAAMTRFETEAKANSDWNGLLVYSYKVLKISVLCRLRYVDALLLVALWVSYVLCLCFSQLSREEQASLEGKSFSPVNFNFS